MGQLFVANPIAGLRGIPDRIVLDEGGITVKTGFVGHNTTIPYNRISYIGFSGIRSLTMSGIISIHTFDNKAIEAMGFYHSQYEAIKAEVLSHQGTR